MAWVKSSESLIEAFHEALPDDDGIERRKMFGFPCAFANGKMFTLDPPRMGTPAKHFRGSPR